ncbi:MAG: VanZ family protein [Planctomycetota bacterium]
MTQARRASLEARLWLTLTLAWMATIFWLSSGRITSPLPKSDWSSFVSNAAHVPVYAILAGLWRQLFWAAGNRKPQAWWLAVILTTLYGVSDETHQSFVAGRTASPYDVLTDLGGAVLGATSAEIVRKLRSWREPLLGIGMGLGLLGAWLDTWMA